MNKSKQLLITSFALFSLFFGAGNLLLPPLLGYNAGEQWIWVTIAFIIPAVVIPIFGIMAHAKLQGTMYDFGKKVSPIFSMVFCVVIYIISIIIPSPRTAAATHEIAIHPFFGTDSLLTSTIYFALVLVFVLNRSKILNIIGKFLTPLIVIMLLMVIGIGLFSSNMITEPTRFDVPFVSGILEGYQTFDAIGAIVVGAVVIVSLNYNKDQSYEEKRTIIKKSGIIAGLGLFIIYAGLISIGAFYGSEINIDQTLSNDMQRANLLRGISISALGNFGNTVLSILIALACFTTAVGIVAGAADYFKGVFKESQKAYIATAVIGCVAGVVVGQLDFGTIIHIAIPVLLCVYPITIILIFLNVLPEQLSSKWVFKIAVWITLLFSIPDAILFLSPNEDLKAIMDYVPLANYSFGWVLPAIASLLITNVVLKLKR